MSRWWWVVALLFLSLGLNLGLLATVVAPRLRAPSPPSPAEDPRPEDRPPAAPPRELIERMADRLDLSGDQRQLFVALQRDFFAHTGEARRRFEESRRRLRRALTAPEPDEATVRAALEESGRAYVELEQAFAEHVLRAREILDGNAERRYLQFLGRLGAAGPRPGPEAPLRRRPPRRGGG